MSLTPGDKNNRDLTNLLPNLNVILPGITHSTHGDAHEGVGVRLPITGSVDPIAALLSRGEMLLHQIDSAISGPFSPSSNRTLTPTMPQL